MPSTARLARTAQPCPVVRAALASAVLASLLWAAPARSQAEDMAEARALFDEARTLMKSGRYEPACPKLEAASKLYPGSGVFLNLGDCYENTGRTASAWWAFGEAMAAAVRAGRPDDETEAQRRQEVLAPRLSRLVVVIVDHPAGLLVRRDGKALEPAAWGTPIPVDPGPHRVDAEAPGREPWSISVMVETPGTAVTVEVPALGEKSTSVNSAEVPAGSGHDLGAPAATPPALGSNDPPAANGHRVAAIATGSVGIAAAVVAGVLAIDAKVRFDTAAQEKGDARHYDSESAFHTGEAATVAAGIAAAGLAGGVVLWLTGSKPSAYAGVAGRTVFVGARF